MWRKRALHIVCAFVAHIEQQSGRLTVDKCEDNAVHIVIPEIAGDSPMEASFESIKCPEAAVVTLGGNDGRSSQYPGHLLGELIGTAYMTREHGDYVRPVGVYADHGRVGVLVFDIGCYGAYTDT